MTASISDLPPSLQPCTHFTTVSVSRTLASSAQKVPFPSPSQNTSVHPFMSCLHVCEGYKLPRWETERFREREADSVPRAAWKVAWQPQWCSSALKGSVSLQESPGETAGCLLQGNPDQDRRKNKQANIKHPQLLPSPIACGETRTVEGRNNRGSAPTCPWDTGRLCCGPRTTTGHMRPGFPSLWCFSCFLESE